MSTLKTHNLQSPDAGSVNIAMTPNAGMIVAGLSTYSNQINVGSNIKLGTAGIITATSFVGSGANLTSLPAQATIANNADNRIITGGSGVNLNGEADLTFDGNDLTVNKTSGDSDVIIKTTTSGNPVLKLNASGAGGHDISHDRSSNSLIFNRTGSAERLRITSSGNVGIGTDNPQVKLTVSSTSPAVCDIHHIDGGTNDEARIILGALAGNPPSNRGAGIAAVNNGAGHDLIIKCSASHSAGPGEKVRITSDGRLSINDSTPNSNETLTIQPVGNIACDVAFKLNNSNDSRIKFYDSGGTYRGGFGFTEYANSTDYPNFHDSFYMTTDPGSNGSLEVVQRVNNNGCFMYPKQPCFSVAMSSDYTTSTTHTANFNTERFDQGNNFNTGSNGIFTAPVTGKYYMHAAIQTMQAGASQAHIMGVSFLINGSVNVSKGSGDQYLGRNGDHYITVHCIRILNLAQGDTVQVYIQLHAEVRIEGSGGSDRCNWQGYLMA